MSILRKAAAILEGRSDRTDGQCHSRWLRRVSIHRWRKAGPTWCANDGFRACGNHRGEKGAVSAGAEDFRRLRELQQEPKPTTVTDFSEHGGDGKPNDGPGKPSASALQRGIDCRL